jgi:hypothetical protein
MPGGRRRRRDEEDDDSDCDEDDGEPQYDQGGGAVPSGTKLGFEDGPMDYENQFEALDTVSSRTASRDSLPVPSDSLLVPDFVGGQLII